jgi:hypothetical protein
LQLKATFKFVNNGDSAITVQNVGWPHGVSVAKTADEARRKQFEISFEIEDFEPRKPQNEAPILVKSGGSFEAKQVVSIPVAQHEKAKILAIGPGVHFLEVENTLTIGTGAPQTWRYLTVRSNPLMVKVEYPPSVPACTRESGLR